MAGDPPTGAASPVQAAQLRYALDPRVSRLTIRAFAGGLLSAFAHNPSFTARKFTGEFTFDPDTLAAGPAKVVIDAGSLDLMDDVSEHDRREIIRVTREQVLEVGRYPTIVFDVHRIDVRNAGGRLQAEVAGSLTLHGVTRDFRAACDVALMGSTVRAYGECALRQTDFGITLVSVAAQAIKVKDELKCVFDLVGRRQE